MANTTIRPIPEIFTDLVSQVTNLVRMEGRLARAEISEKATRALSGMAMILLGSMLLIPALVILLQAADRGAQTLRRSDARTAISLLQADEQFTYGEQGRRRGLKPPHG